MSNIVGNEFLVTHGFSNGTSVQKRFYHTYNNIKARCYNKNGPDYLDYGGRGIKVCDRWLESFENFRDDMWLEYFQRVTVGEKISIDRYPNVNGNYELSNCRWATDVEQARCKRTSSKTKNYDQHLLNMDRLVAKFNTALRRTKESKFFYDLVGMSIIDFKQYMSSKFLPGMTWENRGINRKGKRVWQINHIKELHTFDFSDTENYKLAFHYTNLEPMWWEDNVARNNLRKQFKGKN